LFLLSVEWRLTRDLNSYWEGGQLWICWSYWSALACPATNIHFNQVCQWWTPWLHIKSNINIVPSYQIFQFFFRWITPRNLSPVSKMAQLTKALKAGRWAVISYMQHPAQQSPRVYVYSQDTTYGTHTGQNHKHIIQVQQTADVGTLSYRQLT
jgi:hypothetical protein